MRADWLSAATEKEEVSGRGKEAGIARAKEEAGANESEKGEGERGNTEG